MTKTNKDITSFLIHEGVEGDVDSPATGQLDSFVDDEFDEEPFNNDISDDELAENGPDENDLNEIEGEIGAGEPTSELHAAFYRQGVGVQKEMSAQLYKLFPDKEITIEKITASTVM